MVSPVDNSSQELIDTLWSEYDPNRVVAISAYPPQDNAPTLLKDRPLLNDNSTAYVCQNFVCKNPVNQPQALADQLSRKKAFNPDK